VDAIGLLSAANPWLYRVQGNELHRGIEFAQAA